MFTKSQKKTDELKVIIAGIENNIKESVRPMRKNQADTEAELDNFRTELQSLQGKIEEHEYIIDQKRKEDISFKKEYAAELDRISTDLSELKNRLLVIEGFFISEGKLSQEESHSKKDPAKKIEEEKKKITQKPEPKELYNEAYSDFKRGDIKKARGGFQRYLRLFPNTEYSDNAQYWIGESYFLEKKYREAIVEFEEVIKKYPKGNKTSSALLKQGLSFYRLGDKTSAKLLLQKVIKDYPGTTQAQIARNELKNFM